MAETPEGKVKKAIIKILKQYGAWYCFPATHGYGRSGVPDILVCHEGRFIAIEAKATDKDDPTALQQIELKAIANAGGLAFVVNKQNVEGLHYIFDPNHVATEIRQ